MRDTFQHSKIKFVAPSGHIMFCLFYRYWWNSYIKDNLFFYSFSKQQNSAIKVVTYRKMPVTKMLWSSEKVSMWKFGRSSRKSPVTVPSSHLEAILWMKFQRNRPRAWAGSSLVIALSCCNHGDTNILTRERKKYYLHCARWRYAFLANGRILVFHQYLYNKSAFIMVF